MGGRIMKQRFKHPDMNKIYWVWVSRPRKDIEKVIGRSYASSNSDQAFRSGFSQKPFKLFPINSPLYAVYAAGKEWEKVNRWNKLILDPDADGTQWLYKGMGVSEQKHPELLPYACYDWDRSSFLIGVTTSKKLAMQLIDKYISEGKKAEGYIIYHG